MVKKQKLSLNAAIQNRSEYGVSLRQAYATNKASLGSTQKHSQYVS